MEWNNFFLLLNGGITLRFSCSCAVRCVLHDHGAPLQHSLNNKLLLLAWLVVYWAGNSVCTLGITRTCTY